MTHTVPLTGVRAHAQVDDRNHTTGGVELAALPAWIKNPPYAVADLTVQEARALAIALLQAAERAERGRP